MLLEVRSLTKTYPTADGIITALDSCSFSAQKGEMIMVKGHSGSGKTTLLNLIAGLEESDSGTVLFDSADLSKLSKEKKALLRRHSIGVVYQFYNLIPELTLEENISVSSFLDGKEPDRDRLLYILEKIGLYDRRSSYPDTLSGGEKQRVSVARALYSRPALLLADEPTGNLDSDNTNTVISLMRELNKNEKTTVICVTHSDSLIIPSDRVLTFEKGRLTDDTGAAK